MTLVSSADYWSNRYENNQTGWDEGRPHPFWVERFAHPKTNLKTQTALVVGAGRGHDAHFFSSIFQNVIAIDFSINAANDFQKLYPHSKVDYRILDFLEPLPFAKVDVVLEHTCLCAIDPKRRKEYFQNLSTILKENGSYHAIIFPEANDVDLGTPPFSTPIAEVEKFLNDINFEIIKKEPLTLGFEKRTLKEFYLEAKKKF